jgi:hypothetical protein
VAHGVIEPRASDSGQFAACMNLLNVYCARSAKWQPDIVVGWQRDAGLEPLPMCMGSPGYGCFMASKPKA